MTAPQLVAFSGSARRASLNQSVLAAAVDAARAAGAEVHLVDLNDYPLPVFHQDLEDREGLPEAARALKARFREADGFLIASPEHNSSYSALLKNTIDWCSRAEQEDEAPLSAFAQKSALLYAASPGALGGLRGLFALRELLQNLKVTVYPEMLAIGGADRLIVEGRLTDSQWLGRVSRLTEAYVAFARKLQA